MTSTQIAVLRRSSARLAGTIALLACTVFAIAAPAVAAPVSFGSGHLDWGVKQSFRDYVVGAGIFEGRGAKGMYTASDGATKLPPGNAPTGNGAIRFPVLGGSYDSGTRVGELTIDGAVRFQGHDGQLDMTVRNLCATLAGDGGTLYADISSREMPKKIGEPGATRQYTGVAVVDLAPVPVPTPSGGDLVWSSIATTLNAAAVPVFAQYSAGEAFDPIAPLTATLGDPRPRPDGGPCRSVAPNDGGGGGGGGGGGDGGSQATPTVRGVAKVVTLGRGRVARIATLRCGAANCKVTTPKSVKAKVKRRRYSVAVLAPKSLKAGKSGKLRVRLSRAARKALAGRRTTVKVKVTIVADGRKTTKTIKATLKAKKAKRVKSRR